MGWIRLTHPVGFIMNLEVNQSYRFVYDKVLRPTNISLNATLYDLKPYDYVIFKYNLADRPDKVQFETGTDLTQSYLPLSPIYNSNGDWYWDNDTYTLSFMIINKPPQYPLADFPVLINVYKCRYYGCTPPIDPAYKLPVKSRPKDALFWSDLSTWSTIGRPGWGGNQYGFPKENDNVIIPDGKYVVFDCKLPNLMILQIEGVLEFDNGMDHYLEVEFIFINGGQLIIGWENDPILTDVEIVLTNKRDTFGFRLPNYLTLVGTKGIGVYGGLDLHGRPRNVTWTRLNNTATAGSNTITLAQPVDWEIGDEIVITTTTFVASQNDVMIISNISSDLRTLALNSSLNFTHIAYNETLPSGSKYQIAAGVGLLTRNLKIRADETDSLPGMRIIVSDYSTLVNGIITYYKGYARISNAEIIHPGQENYYSGDDSRYGILYSDLGKYNYSRPSYVRSSSFHEGYSCAIGSKI